MLKIFDRFTPRANAADTDYPFGSFKNETVPGARDGTPLNADWANDHEGFDTALLADAGITPNGLPDTAIASQRLDALKAFSKPASSIDFTSYVPLAPRFERFVAGPTHITGAALRDAFVTARTLTTLTDCHAFADRTIISNATDSGTYGTFDSTTEIAGTHAQSHQFSYQNRAKFSGEGSIATWGGYISWPTLTGAASTVGELFHFEAKDLDSLGRFDAVSNQFGIKVHNQTKGATGNYAFWTTQAVGYTLYAPAAGKVLVGGESAFTSRAIFGASKPMVGVPLSWVGTVGAPKGYASSSLTTVQWGVEGDYAHQWVSNSAERLVLENSTKNYALRPASGTQDLGISTRGFNIAWLKQVRLDPIASASAENLSLFVNSATGALSFKDSGGVVKAITMA